MLQLCAEYFVLQFAILKYKDEINRTIIMRVVFYGCETSSLTIKLRDLEKRVLRKIFGHKREEVTGEWRKLHNEELNNLC